MGDKKKLWTVGQIDATGIKGPHEKELEDISQNKYPLFIDIDNNTLTDIVTKDLGGLIENIGLNEDWTITIEMFPEVNVHMCYFYYGDEFGDGLEAEFKFFFSGEIIFPSTSNFPSNSVILVGPFTNNVCPFCILFIILYSSYYM